MKEKIIQFGEGGFLRGFADWMIQKVNDNTDFGGKVVVVQPIKEGLCDMLTSQGCTYNHICRGVEGVETSKIDVISRCVKVYDEFDEYLRLAENPDFRFVISNTTEAGICFNESDLITDRPASTFPAKLTQLLKRRFDLGLGGFIFLPCELNDKNGELLKKCVLDYARLWELGADFINWLEKDNVFCSTLVDRINTGFPKNETFDFSDTDRMINTSEFFHLWVIDGYDRLFDEIPFDKCGLNVVLTNNIDEWRTRKVRILNGAHTSLVCFGLLEGFGTVGECMDNERMEKYVRKCIFEEIIPTLPYDKKEMEEYAENVITRFKNPYIQHELMSIVLNSVSKFKVRVLPSIIEYIRLFGKVPETLTFSFAKLIEFYKTGTPRDSEDVIEFMKNADVDEILENENFWGKDLTFLKKDVEKYTKNA